MTPIIAVAALPPLGVESPVFNGRSAECCALIDAFDNLISTTGSSPKRELFYLLRYTSGPANALVKVCQCLSDDEGYAKARRLLKAAVGQVF